MATQSGVALKLVLILSLVKAYTCTAISPVLVHSWVHVDYDWPNASMKHDYVTSGRFMTRNNVITGIKVYKDEVYVTVPRWLPGVPSTLNRIVVKDGHSVLTPFPTWEYQSVGNCDALQYVQSMEIDQHNGHMWIIDNGRININTDRPSNVCPPKLVVYDINRKVVIRRYIFPDDVANHTTCFLNDIVLHFEGDRVKFAYITDTRDAKLYVYNVEKNASWFFLDDSMKGKVSATKGWTGIPLDGIAISADNSYVYYCPIDSLSLNQVPTTVLRQKGASLQGHVREVGKRAGRSDGLVIVGGSLYYGLLDGSGVNRWLLARDAQRRGEGDVTLMTQEPLARDDVRMRWVDTFAWDADRHELWFVANNLQRFFNGTMDFSGASGANMYVWKVFLGGVPDHDLVG